MKKLITTLLFSAFSLLAFTQSTFTEKTLTDMRQRMLSMGWDKFSKEEVSPDFVMHGNDGKPCDMRCMEELNKSATLVEWPMEQIKIQQVDNAVTITGITHHSGVDKKTIKNGQITNILPKLTPPKWQMDMVDSAIHRYLSIYARIK